MQCGRRHRRRGSLRVRTAGGSLCPLSFRFGKFGFTFRHSSRDSTDWISAYCDQRPDWMRSEISRQTINIFFEATTISFLWKSSMQLVSFKPPQTTITKISLQPTRETQDHATWQRRTVKLIANQNAPIAAHQTLRKVENQPPLGARLQRYSHQQGSSSRTRQRCCRHHPCPTKIYLQNSSFDEPPPILK